MHEGRYAGSGRRPLFDVSSVARGRPEVAWDIAAQLIGNRQRGAVIERDPRAHEALRLLGGQAAYDAVASTPDLIRPKFIRVYALLSDISDLMCEIESLVGGKAPVLPPAE